MKIKSLVLLILLSLTTVLGACQGGKEAEEPKNGSPAVESQQEDNENDDGEKQKKDGDNEQDKDDDDD